MVGLWTLVSMKSNFAFLFAVSAFSFFLPVGLNAQGLRQEFSAPMVCYGNQANLCVKGGRVFNKMTGLTLGFVGKSHVYSFGSMLMKTEYYMKGKSLEEYYCMTNATGVCQSKAQQKVHSQSN